MKKMIVACVAAVAFGFSAITFADAQVGVVDMEKIFSSSKEVQQINQQLTSQFSVRKDKIMVMGKQLQADLTTYNKNKSVMSKSKLADLQTKIGKEEGALRDAQGKFQQDLFAAQNEKMSSFMDKVKNAVEEVAKKKDLVLVLPKNATLYVKDGGDITSQVQSDL